MNYKLFGNQRTKNSRKCLIPKHITAYVERFLQLRTIITLLFELRRSAPVFLITLALMKAIDLDLGNDWM